MKTGGHGQDLRVQSAAGLWFRSGWSEEEDDDGGIRDEAGWRSLELCRSAPPVARLDRQDSFQRDERDVFSYLELKNDPPGLNFTECALGSASLVARLRLQLFHLLVYGQKGCRNLLQHLQLLRNTTQAQAPSGPSAA